LPVDVVDDFIAHILPDVGFGLTHLRDLTSLRELDLWKTKVTSAGLPNLTGLSRLEKLTIVVGDEVSEEAIDKLRKALPRLRVER
jgi:hypothetical protein